MHRFGGASLRPAGLEGLLFRRLAGILFPLGGAGGGIPKLQRSILKRKVVQYTGMNQAPLAGTYAAKVRWAGQLG